MLLTTEKGSAEHIGDPSQIVMCVSALKQPTNTFAILASKDQHYLQTALTDGGFVLEKRLGSAGHHFTATHFFRQPTIIYKKPWWKFWGQAETADCFQQSEVVAAFSAFFSGSPDPTFLRWNRLDL
jgi:hypothetical protein